MKRLRRARLPHWIVPPVYQGALYPRLFWDCEPHHVTAQPISEIRKQLQLDLHTSDRCHEMVLTVLAERPGLDPAFAQHYQTVRFWQHWLYDREDEQLLLQAWELSKYTASRGQHATIMAFM
eukprot:5206480-Amphidinium_carterae.1